MLALLKDVPVINHPVFRLVLGVALVAAGLALHHNILIVAVGGLMLIMAIVHGASILRVRTQKGQF